MQIGPYRLGERLGRGGMGEVFRAHDTRLRRDVAVKHLRDDRDRGPDAEERLQREARALASLSHPSIVPIFDLLEDESGTWIVMELVAGPTLGELVHGSSGGLEVGRALRLAKQIAEGLAEAHEKGILHRDLKAENVLVARNDTVRIVDFGLAKPLEKLPGDTTVSASGLVVGTLRSMSPEQARGLEIDPRSDLFSLGVLIYEMLSGVSPFRGETPTDTLAKICGFPHESLAETKPSVPAALSRLVDQLLQKAPERRPSDARQVATALEELLGDVSPASASEIAPAEPADHPLGDATEPATWTDFRATAKESAQQETVLEGPDRPRSALSRRTQVAVVVLVISALAGLGLASRWLPGISLWPNEPNRPVEPAAGVESEDPPLNAHELYVQGMELLDRHDQAGQIDRAIRAFRIAVDKDPSSAAGYAGLARAYVLKYLTEGRDPHWLELAEPAAETAVEKDEYLAAAAVSAGMTLTALGRLEEAESELRRALVLAPGSVEAHRALGRLMVRLRRFDDAEAAYLRAVELDAEDSWSWDFLGELYFRSRRLEEAEAAFRRSAALRPDSFLPLRNLAAVLQVEGRLVEATEVLQQALTLQPDATVYSNLGTLFFVRGLYSESAGAFRKALDSGEISHSSVIWGNLGDAYRFIPGKEQEAQEAFRRAAMLLRQRLKSDPGHLTSRSRLAQMLAKAGDSEAALAELEATDWPHSESAGLLYRSVVTLEILGRRQRALEALTLALKAGAPVGEIERDPELIDLRADPDYHRIIVALESSD